MGIQSGIMVALATARGQEVAISTIAAKLSITNKQVYDSLVWLQKKDPKHVQKVSAGLNGVWKYVNVSKVQADMEPESETLKHVPNPVMEKFFDEFVSSMADKLVENIKASVANRIDQLVAETVTTVKEQLNVKLGSLAQDTSLNLAVEIESEVNSLTGNLISDVLERISLSSKIAASDETPVKSVRIVKPRIAVCNLLPSQEQIIEQKFRNQFNIVFWNDNTGSSTKQLKKIAIGCEKVFWHVNHSSHSAFETLRSAGANYENVTGGMSTMVNALEEYAAQLA